MIRTLKDSKAKLSELVSAAAAGEEILITVKGVPKARLVGVETPIRAVAPDDWVSQLTALQEQYTLSASPSKSDTLNELREDRW